MVTVKSPLLESFKKGYQGRKKEEKEKKKGITKVKLSKKKLKSRKVLKRSKVSYKVPEYRREGVFDDPNRFFTGELEETKKSMFIE